MNPANSFIALACLTFGLSLPLLAQVPPIDVQRGRQLMEKFKSGETLTVECSRDLARRNVPVTFLGTTPLNADFETAWYEATPAVSGETKPFLRLRVFQP